MTDEEIRRKWEVAQRIQAMFICPTTGKLIDTCIGDDKVTCFCTRLGTHRVAELRRATYDDFARRATYDDFARHARERIRLYKEAR